MQNSHIAVLESAVNTLLTAAENIELHDAKFEASDQVRAVVKDLEQLLFEIKGE